MPAHICQCYFLRSLHLSILVFQKVWVSPGAGVVLESSQLSSHPQGPPSTKGSGRQYMIQAHSLGSQQWAESCAVPRQPPGNGTCLPLATINSTTLFGFPLLLFPLCPSLQLVPWDCISSYLHLSLILRLCFGGNPNLRHKGNERSGALLEKYLWEPIDGCGLPWWLNDKESACNARDTALIPGSGRSPGEGNGNLLHPSFLPGKSHGQRSLAGCGPWGCQSQTWLSDKAQIDELRPRRLWAVPWRCPTQQEQTQLPRRHYPEAVPCFLPVVGVAWRKDRDSSRDSSSAHAQLLDVWHLHWSLGPSQEAGQDRDSSSLDQMANQKHSHRESFEIGLITSLIKSLNKGMPIWHCLLYFDYQ